MIAYKIDSTEDGILSALFESFTMKEKPIAVFSGDFQTQMGCEIKNLSVYPKNCDRVRKALLKYGGISLLSKLFFCLRSCDDLKETIIFNAAYKCLFERKDVTQNFADPDMVALYEVHSRISYERHRILGFLRFQKTAGGIWYAHFSPDNDIVDIVAPHFTRRFPKESFVIHDVKRNIMSLYNGNELLTVECNEPTTVYLSQDEEEFQHLWQTYFDAVSIFERTNEKLQNNFLPSRYRKHMNEFLKPENFN